MTSARTNGELPGKPIALTVLVTLLLIKTGCSLQPAVQQDKKQSAEKTSVSEDALATHPNRETRGEVNVLDFGAKNDGTDPDKTTAAIQAAVDTGKDVDFPRGHYLISSTITVKNYAGERPQFPQDYGQQLFLHGSTITAAPGFSGDHLFHLKTSQAGLIGWGNLQAKGNAANCVYINASMCRIVNIRCYGHTRSGVFIAGTYGTLVESIYGEGGATASVGGLVEVDNATGVRIHNAQCFREHGYLIRMNRSVGSIIEGGTPDKSDLGVYLNGSQAVIQGMNFEGTRKPAYIMRSYVTFEGGRFHATGAGSLGPANSSDGRTFDRDGSGNDVNDAAGRAKGTYNIKLNSGRVAVMGMGVSGTGEVNIDASENQSGNYSNEIVWDANQAQLHDFKNKFHPTTRIFGGDETIILFKAPENLTVKGAKSSRNQIALEEIVVTRGFDVTPPQSNGSDHYQVEVAGLYEIELWGEFADDAGTASSVEFSLVEEPSNRIPFTESYAVDAGKSFRLKGIVRINHSSGFRIQGVTDSQNKTAILTDVHLKVERIENY